MATGKTFIPFLSSWHCSCYSPSAPLTGAHAPRHVHVFEDGKRCLKFNIESWTVMEGNLSTKVRKALESLKSEGVFDEKP